jgi:hypothetical protein
MAQTSTKGRARAWTSWLFAAVALASIAAPAPTTAFAETDRIAELSTTLSSSSSDKERISAVTALGRLGDKRALRPLVTALRDDNPTVRAIAAAALGKLGHRASMPALREATHDPDAVVRKRAQEALAQVHSANGLPPPGAEATPPEASGPIAPMPAVTAKPMRAGFGSAPRTMPARPDLYVVVKSASDDSPGRLDKKTRKGHAEIVKATMLSSLRGEPTVTSTAADADKLGLDPRALDLSIVMLEQRINGNYIEIEAQLRLAVSDRRGKMLSFLSGGAKVQVPRRSFNASYLPQVRREALENAVRGIFDKLLRHLRSSPTT